MPDGATSSCFTARLEGGSPRGGAGGGPYASRGAPAAGERSPSVEAGGRTRGGPPIDETRDLELEIWAGVLPFDRRPGEPLRDEHTKEGIPVPEYVRNYPEGRT